MTGKKPTDTETEARVVPDWHVMTKEEVIKTMGLNENVRRTGLTTKEAEAALALHGENQLSTEEKEGLCIRIWHHINNVLVMILVFVACISIISVFADIGSAFQNWIQVGIIVGVIV